MTERNLKIAVVCSSNQNRSMEAHNFLSKRGFNIKSFGTGSQVKLPGPAPNQPNIYDFNTTYEEMYKDLSNKDKNLYLNLTPRICVTKSKSNKVPSKQEKQAILSDEQHDLCWEYMFYTCVHEVPRFLPLRMASEEKLCDFLWYWCSRPECGSEELRYTQNGILHMLDRNRRIKAKPQRFQNCPEKFDVVITCEERVYDQVIEDFQTRDKEESMTVHVINIDIQDNHEEATIGAFMICDLCTMLEEADDLDNEIDEVLQEFESRCQRQILHMAEFY